MLSVIYKISCNQAQQQLEPKMFESQATFKSNRFNLKQILNLNNLFLSIKQFISKVFLYIYWLHWILSFKFWNEIHSLGDWSRLLITICIYNLFQDLKINFSYLHGKINNPWNNIALVKHLQVNQVT